MKHISGELTRKIEDLVKDQSQLEELIDRASSSIKGFREEHAFVAGTAEAAIGFTAIAVGVSICGPTDVGTRVPELISAVLAGGVGGGAGGAAASMMGGIGVAMMGTAFAIPAAAITAIGATVGASTGLITGWFGAELASQTTSLAASLFANFSGFALIAFGCYMLFWALKDLWRAGGEFISYLKSLGVNEIEPEGLS